MRTRVITRHRCITGKDGRVIHTHASSIHTHASSIDTSSTHTRHPHTRVIYRHASYASSIDTRHPYTRAPHGHDRICGPSPGNPRVLSNFRLQHFHPLHFDVKYPRPPNAKEWTTMIGGRGYFTSKFRGWKFRRDKQEINEEISLIIKLLTQMKRHHEETYTRLVKEHNDMMMPKKKTSRSSYNKIMIKI